MKSKLVKIFESVNKVKVVGLLCEQQERSNTDYNEGVPTNPDNAAFLPKSQIKEQQYTVYHGTNNQFDKFDLDRATQGIVWFTDSIDSIKNQTHGGMGSKYIMKRTITLNNPAGWDEYEKYSLGELKDLKYDGVILPSPSEGKTDYIVFSTKQIRK